MSLISIWKAGFMAKSKDVDFRKPGNTASTRRQFFFERKRKELRRQGARIRTNEASSWGSEGKRDEGRSGIWNFIRSRQRLGAADI